MDMHDLFGIYETKQTQQEKGSQFPNKYMTHLLHIPKLGNFYKMQQCFDF